MGEVLLSDEIHPRRLPALTSRDFCQDCLTYEDLWRAALRAKSPIRTRANWSGILLPEPDIGLWSNVFNECFICHKQQPRWSAHQIAMLQTHHITRRGHCHKPHQNWIENLFRTCLRCHETLLATMPAAKQIAYKWKMDRCGWETIGEFLERFLMVRDGPVIKAKFRVTPDDVENETLSIG